MAQRSSITGHPRFAALIALWFAALLSLTVAVLPDVMLARAMGAAGLGGLLPLTLATRLAIAGAAAAIGAVVGLMLARRITIRFGADPRPIYAEAAAEFDAPEEEQAVRRPLHVREELADGFGDESQVVANDQAAHDLRTDPDPGLMILTPQPTHPPGPEPELAALLERLDTAVTTFHNDETARTESGASPFADDPVQSFVAQQTGVTAPASPAPSAPRSSPLGGLVPDHQAELRAALDKLARSRGQV